MKRTIRGYQGVLGLGMALILLAVPALAEDALPPEIVDAISQAMYNPISELFIFQMQYDSFQMKLPTLDEEKTLGAFKFIPTWPIPLNSKLNWVSRLVVPINSLPVNKRFGDLVGLSLNPGGEPLRGKLREVQGAIQDILADPFDRTTGLGDMVYMGLLGPRTPPKFGDNTFIYAGGFTTMFPTASETILGLGKYSAGPAGVVAYLTEKFKFGALPQHWWSYAGDDDRSDVNLTNIQYFTYWTPNPLTAIGMMPNIVINWEADEKLTLPVGIGANRTVMMFGKLPVRIGAEFHYYVEHPDDTAHPDWEARFLLVPVIPAPWGELGKAIKEAGM